MALIDFGMKARRERFKVITELADMKAQYDEMRFLAQKHEDQARLEKAMHKGVSRRLADRDSALEEIASSTAKHASAVRLANIARKALGRPVGGGDE